MRYANSKIPKVVATRMKDLCSLNSSKIYLINKKSLTVKYSLIDRKMDLSHIFIILMSIVWYIFRNFIYIHFFASLMVLASNNF